MSPLSLAGSTLKSVILRAGRSRRRPLTAASHATCVSPWEVGRASNLHGRDVAAAEAMASENARPLTSAIISPSTPQQPPLQDLVGQTRASAGTFCMSCGAVEVDVFAEVHCCEQPVLLLRDRRDQT